MPRPWPDSARGRLTLGIAFVCVAAVVLIWLLKLPGFLLATALTVAILSMVRSRPNASEHTALRSSIQLSAEDISDVLNEYKHFLTSSDAEALADRTLNRPALADKDCTHPYISGFFYQCSAAQRFLNRLDARLAKDLETAELENLLAVTDQRASKLTDVWILARRAAYQLGSDYS